MTSVETVGDIQATCDVSGLPLEGPDADSRIQGGGRGEGEFSKGHGEGWRYVSRFFLSYLVDDILRTPFFDGYNFLLPVKFINTG